MEHAIYIYWAELMLTVLLLQFGGSPLKIGDEEYHLFRDSE